MQSSHIIRLAKSEDLPQLIDLVAAHAAYEKWDDFRKEGKQAALEQLMFGAIPHIQCLVVEENGKLTGYTAFSKQYSMWEAMPYYYMDCLYLDSATRGKGIGAQLMLKIKEIAHNDGCNLIQWQTPSFNVRAINFYKRMGAVGKKKERFYLRW